MTKSLRYSVIIGAIMLIVIGFMPVKLARGNPIPLPNPYTLIGTDFEGTQFKFKCGNVTMDVYSEYTAGKGTYVIENLANTTNNLNVYFVAWYRPVNVTAVTVNQTAVSFTPIHNWSGQYHYAYGHHPCLTCEEALNGFIPMSFPTNGTEVLEIWWNFPSIEIYDDFDRFPDRTQWTTYNTGYLINGGNNWGGIPIEWEDVRFNFHTNAYFTQGRNISLIYNCSYSIMNETSVELPLDAAGVPYYQYHAENINVSTCISMRNVPYYQTRDEVAFATFFIATGAAIACPLLFIKKARKDAVGLSLFGLACSITFYIWPFWNFLIVGIAMLAVYLVGVSLILLYPSLHNRLRKRTYKSEFRDRIRKVG